MAVGFILVLISISTVLCSDVLELTDSTFKSGIENEEIILVEFYAPWCGHCKRLAPEYEIAATALLKNDPPVKLAKVDCVGEGKESCSKYSVSGYPTLKIFRNGGFSQEYDGPRESAGIISYMKKNSGPSSVLLRDFEHLQLKLSDAADVTIVGFFTSEDHKFKSFMKAADQKRTDFNFAHSLSNEINKQAGHKDELVLYRPKHLHANFEKAEETLNTDLDTSNIIKFITEKANGIVGQIKPETEDKFPRPLVVVYYDVDWKKNPKGSKYWRNRVARVAKKFVNEINFAIGARADYTKQLTDLGFDTVESNLDPNAVAFDVKGSKFKMTTDFSVENLERFTNEFKNQELKPYIKSEPLPVDNNGPVKIVVGENFNEIVNDPTKDVLIEFYAPWCGHCKSLEPKYKELGEKLAGVKDIVIAKMDATANDVPPPYEVSGFPTIYWVPAENKQSPKKYNSAREVDSFIEFIKSEATKPFKLPDSKSKKKTKKEL
ncbi:protein disulfide-isomerase A3 [Hydra vulgaris]|uniref:Protein disulfide-isomerase n=1 Tax=Hydra vulgaris TaxID=6087 RepID=A0ABM4DAN8_HYDVU